MSESNVGARMLKSMGWRSGEGLGKEGTGIVAPVTAESYVKGAGLGTSGGRQDMEELGANNSYKDRAKFIVSYIIFALQVHVTCLLIQSLF